MRDLLIFDILLGGLGTVALIATYSYLWMPLNIAVLRQRLFKIRRDLFAYAADGHVSFKSPAYLQLNDTINGIIGFADKVTAAEAMLCAFVVDTPPVDATGEAIREISDDKTRLDLVAMHEAIHREIVRHLAITSPLFWATVLPLGLIFFLKQLLRGKSLAFAAHPHSGFPARNIEAAVRAREMSSDVFKPWSGEAAA
jgi:hypothetical protein